MVVRCFAGWHRNEEKAHRRLRWMLLDALKRPARTPERAWVQFRRSTPRKILSTVNPHTLPTKWAHRIDLSPPQATAMLF